MGRSCKNSRVCTESYSTQSTRQHDTRRNFLWQETKVSHLEIFNCHVYIHIPKEKRTKLDPLGKKGIFLGYSESLKAYRYFPGFKKIDINRDVTFDEDTTYNKSRKKPTEEPEEAEAPCYHLSCT